MDHSANDTTRAWVEVDLGALRQNGAALARRAGVPIIPMIKADAYGVGAPAAVRALDALDPWGYGVATVDEGAALRAAGVERPILLFTPLAAGEVAGAREAALTPALSSRGAITEWASTGLPWHLAIDTGMSRAGIRWDELGSLGLLPSGAYPQGAFTHFHSAERNDGSAGEQERRFERAIAGLARRPALLHCENGAAIVRRERSRWDLVRGGVFLYGVGSGDGAAFEPAPVVSVRARVVDMRTLQEGETVSYCATYRAVGRRRIATLSIGYGDGYRRALSNRGSALVRGARVPVAGLVTMDMTMLDVTDVPCELGDIATLVGADGRDALPLEAVARAADMSPYELLTGLRGRLARVYREAPA
ncbi:MAG: alanine racemase [Gemmatimonadaceae bacterium]